MKFNHRNSLLFIALVILIAVASLRSVRGYLLFPQQQSQPGTLAAYVEEAQAQSVSQYSFPSGFHEYVVPETWDEVLNNFSFVIAEPLEKRSYGTGNDTTITSFYKFRILETLRSRPAPFAVTNPPTDMSAPQPNEFFMFKWGGLLSLSGVQLVAEEPTFPEFTMGQQYLMVMQLDASSKMANNALGPFGAYIINSNGTFESISPNGSTFETDLSTRYNNSINQLRAALSTP
ncbi:MAG TPA: hypothetical protein VGQ39_18655 [Pyrinomonadaceae bacterium]|jgi:hypothetical protein|nr:hypothetical protein [Pyrinomonadaceae bacterium]